MWVEKYTKEIHLSARIVTVKKSAKLMMASHRWKVTFVLLKLGGIGCECFVYLVVVEQVRWVDCD